MPPSGIAVPLKVGCSLGVGFESCFLFTAAVLAIETRLTTSRKTSIAHIATVCGSVYTGGKTAKDIEKQAEQSAITADDGEIIEIPEPVELYETDCLREPEDSEDASPYDPL